MMISSSIDDRRRGPDTPPKRLAQMVRGSLLVSAGVLLAQPDYIQGVQASPQGGNVVGGSGAISQPNQNTTIVHQQSSSLAIDWQSFDVAKPDLVRFNQPSASAAVLNRVLNQTPSQIFGAIQANGHVFIINPRGVVFGKSARVNVGGLFATSLDISNDDFMAGRYNFSAHDGETPGAIVNNGLIEAASGGFVALVGGSVSNAGTIVADLGHVHLAAGRTAVLDFDGAGLLHIQVDDEILENLEGGEDAVSNTGEIYASGGTVTLSAKVASDVFTRAINNEGTIKAGQIIKGENGKVTLAGFGASVVNTGTIDVSAETQDADGGDIVITSDTVIEQLGVLTADASNGDGGSVTLESDDTTYVTGDAVISATSGSGKGGTVQVLGERVGLFDDASIDVSGEIGGGTALIGGDYQGSNPDVANATEASVGANTTISADAVTAGDGGRIVVWSDAITEFHGTASARGGDEAGDGDFVEVSGKDTFTFTGIVDRRAPNGEAGLLLLDPTTLNVVSGSAGLGEIQDSLIVMLLGMGPVTGQASGGVGSGPGTITIKTGANLTWSNANQLTVIANDDAEQNIDSGTITVETGVVIVNSGGANIEFQAGTVNLSSPVIAGGTLSGGANAPTTVMVNAGGRVQDGVDVAGAGAVVSLAIAIYDENVTISGTTGLTLQGATGTASDVSITPIGGGNGITVTSTDGVTIQDLSVDVSVGTGTGIVVNGSGTETLTIDNVDISYDPALGIGFDADNLSRLNLIDVTTDDGGAGGLGGDLSNLTTLSWKINTATDGSGLENDTVDINNTAAGTILVTLDSDDASPDVQGDVTYASTVGTLSISTGEGLDAVTIGPDLNTAVAVFAGEDVGEDDTVTFVPGGLTISSMAISGSAESKTYTWSDGSSTAYYEFETVDLGGVLEPATFDVELAAPSDGTDTSFSVSFDGAEYTFMAGGADPFGGLFDEGSFDGGITLTGGAGDDDLTITFDDLSLGDVTFDGGGQGVAGDSLIITGTRVPGGVHEFNFNSTDPDGNAGSVVLDRDGTPTTITFTGLEPLTNAGIADAIVFNLNASANNATLQDISGPDGNTQLSDDDGAPGTFETTTFANPNDSLTINMGDGNDQFTVASVVSHK